MNFISANDFSKSQIKELFGLSKMLKDKSKRPLSDRKPIMALLFEKVSTRTRISFESAMLQLGGHPIYIDARTSQLSRGESISDTARVLSTYVDIIAARMNRHSDLEEFASHSDVPVINALTDFEHPCQSLSDIYTILEEFGKISGIKIAFVGDIASNTANSLMITASKMGADVSLVGPKGYAPNEAYIKKANENTDISVCSILKDGLKDCDVIYTDTFISMGQETESKRRRRIFSGYQVNQEMLKYAKKGVRIMHCLPAHRGEEITSEALDSKNSLVWKQAANKLVVEKAIILYLLRQPK